MPQPFHWSDYLVFTAFLMIYAFVGIYYRFRSFFRRKFNTLLRRSVYSSEDLKQNVEEIFLGGRKLTLFPIMASVMASFLSAVSLLGSTSEAYQIGVQFLFMILSYIGGFSVTAEVYMPVFYKLRLSSAHEYLEWRFGRSVRLCVAITFCLQMFLYIALAMFAPALALSQVIGIPIWLSILTTGVVATFYTALGGIRAVVWTDLLQLIVLTGGLFSILIMSIVKTGGPTRVWEIAMEGRRLQTFDFDPSPFKKYTFWTMSFGSMGMILSIYAGNQIQIQRYLACRTIDTARKAILLNIPLNAIFLFVQVGMGLVMYAFFAGCDPFKNKEITVYDQLLPYIVMIIFDGIPVVRGIFLAVIFAAALSTVSSGLNSLANVLLDDLIRPVHFKIHAKEISEKRKVKVAFALAILIGIITFGIAFIFNTPNSRVLQISFSLFGAIGGPILTIFTLGILFPCVNVKGAIAGLIASLTMGLWLCFGSVFNPAISVDYRLPLTTENCTSTSNQTITTTTMGYSDSTTPVTPQSWSIYRLSHFYYTLVCLISGTILALIVSAIFKFNTRDPVNPKLLAWQTVAVCRYLPDCFPTQIDYSMLDTLDSRLNEKPLVLKDEGDLVKNRYSMEIEIIRENDTQL